MTAHNTHRQRFAFSWWSSFVRFDRCLDSIVPLLLALLIVVVLRLPSLAEPYWYGDEGIYLTIGQALRHGERLYADIIDHKTPIIYYLAMVPNQAWFRVLMFVWSLGSVFITWRIAKHLLTSPLSVACVTIGMAILLNGPAFEGHITNGELLFILPMLLAILLSIRIIRQLTQQPSQQDSSLLLPAVGVGVLISIATHIKVPAVFDAASIGVVLCAELFAALGTTTWKAKCAALARVIGGMAVGFFGVMLLFIVLSALQGALGAYLQFGLLYNFRYAGYWVPTVSNPALLIFTKLPVKMLLMLVWFGALVLWYRRRVIQAHHVMIMSWFAASLVASTLSNRPYPHYFLQVLPPLVFCGGVAIDAVVAVLRRARYSRNALVVLALCVVCGATAYGTGKLLQLGTYPTLSYYQHYWNWITGKLTWQAYAQAFHPFWQDNATLTSIITANPEPYLFIWGDNPILYAQTGKIPVGRFTVAFHIKDFRAQQETLQAALEKKPPFVVVINDDRTTLPGLDGFLDTFYIRDQTPLQYMTLYRRVRK